jgi:hypothetical protein
MHPQPKNLQTGTEEANPEFEQALTDFIDQTIELERSHYQSDFVPFQVYAEKLRQNLSQELHQFQQSYAKGYRVLFDELQKKIAEADLVPYRPNLDRKSVV